MGAGLSIAAWAMGVRGAVGDTDSSRRPWDQRSSGTRTCTLKIDEAPASSRPLSTSSASKRLGDRSRPSRSIAYASPVAPVWPLLRTTLNVRSGSTRKQSAPPELPASATHAHTNWVGAPARTTPLASGSGISGRQRAGDGRALGPQAPREGGVGGEVRRTAHELGRVGRDDPQLGVGDRGSRRSRGWPRRA